MTAVWAFLLGVLSWFLLCFTVGVLLGHLILALKEWRCDAYWLRQLDRHEQALLHPLHDTQELEGKG
jgi:hypothetical protein